MKALRCAARLKRRIETLVRTIEKELEGPLKKDKEKRRASAGTKRKASHDEGAGAKVSPPAATLAGLALISKPRPGARRRRRRRPSGEST